MPEGNPAGYAQPQINTMKRFRQMNQGQPVQGQGQAPMPPGPEAPDPGKASVLRGLAEALGIMGPPVAFPGAPRMNADVRLPNEAPTTAELIQRSQSLINGGR